MKKDPNHWERYREIGFRIAYCRKYQKMTQEELAEKLNVSRQHIGAIEALSWSSKIVTLGDIFSSVIPNAA